MRNIKLAGVEAALLSINFLLFMAVLFVSISNHSQLPLPVLLELTSVSSLMYGIVFFLMCVPVLCCIRYVVTWIDRYPRVFMLLSQGIILSVVILVFHLNLKWFSICLPGIQLTALRISVIILWLFLLIIMTVAYVLRGKVPTSSRQRYLIPAIFILSGPLLCLLVYCAVHVVMGSGPAGSDMFHASSGAVGNRQSSPRVFVLGIDGLDYSLVQDYLDQGIMPNLSSLTKQSVTGPLKTHVPTSSPVIWTTIATGMKPYQHGILDFVTYTHKSSGSIVYLLPRFVFWGRIARFLGLEPRPVSSGKRKAKAFWDIIPHAGKKVGIVNWWASQPAYAVNGFMVTSFFYGKKSTSAEDILHHSSTYYYPQGSYLTTAITKGFEVINEMDPATDIRLGASVIDDPSDDRERYRQSVLKHLAIKADTFYLAVGMDLYHTLSPDVMALYLNGVDIAEHLFWNDRTTIPMRQARIQRSNKSVVPSSVIENYYQWIDEKIGEIWRNLHEDTVLIVLSDHGMETIPRLKRLYYRWIKRMPYLEGYHDHAPPGYLLINGPGIRKNVIISDATVFDIAPTILRLCGLPGALSMHGRSLHQALDLAGKRRYPERRAVDYGPHEMTPEAESGLLDQPDMLQHLRQLGYLE